MTDSAPGTALPLSHQLDFVSAINGHSYRIRVVLPFAPPPPAGYPVLYLTDGDYFIGSFGEAIRIRALGAEVEGAVVVGIGYPDDFATASYRRSLDLTPSAPDAGRRNADTAAFGRPAAYGGAGDFAEIIATEVVPRVAALTTVDPARAMLWGHSLGGLFVLHTLFTRPALFATWLAQSPTIWWDDRLLLKLEPAFARSVTAGEITPRLMIAMGGAEQTLPPFALPDDVRQRVSERLAFETMVDGARDLGERLAALSGAPGYQARFLLSGGAAHMGAPFAALGAMIEFALPPRHLLSPASSPQQPGEP